MQSYRIFAGAVFIKSMQKLFLLLGSNLGDRYHFINEAVKKIEVLIGDIVDSSSLYETEPWGFKSKNWFLNRVVVVQTNLDPESILKVTQNIELSLNRSRIPGLMTSRTIDIDLLFYGEQVVHSADLTIPHPAIQDRLFTLVPLMEVAPDFVHPVLQKPLKQLVKECQDQMKVLELNSAVGLAV